MKTQKVSSASPARGQARPGEARTEGSQRTLNAHDQESLRTALHDGLGQILTSISFLASSLSQKLAGRRLPEATEAQELLSLAGRAISETKALVREKDSARATAEPGGRSAGCAG